MAARSAALKRTSQLASPGTAGVAVALAVGVTLIVAVADGVLVAALVGDGVAVGATVGV